MAVTVIQDNADLGTFSAGDTLTITGKFTGNITDITTNLDQSGLGAGGFAEVHVTRNFMAQFGSPTVPFKAEVNSGSVKRFRYDAGAGECYYSPDGNSDVCDTLRVTGQGSMHLIGSVGTINNLEQIRGQVFVGAGVAPTTVRGAGGYMLIDGESGTSPTTIWAGGDFNLRTLRGIAGGGNLYLFGRARVAMDAGTDTIPTIWMLGGFLDLVQCGTITTFHLLDGDASQIRIGRAITITTLNVWPTVRNADKFINHPLLTIGTTNRQIDPVAA